MISNAIPVRNHNNCRADFGALVVSRSGHGFPVQASFDKLRMKTGSG